MEALRKIIQIGLRLTTTLNSYASFSRRRTYCSRCRTHRLEGSFADHPIAPLNKTSNSNYLEPVKSPLQMNKLLQILMSAVKTEPAGKFIIFACVILSRLLLIIVNAYIINYVSNPVIVLYLLKSFFVPLIIFDNVTILLLSLPSKSLRGREMRLASGFRGKFIQHLRHLFYYFLTNRIYHTSSFLRIFRKQQNKTDFEIDPIALTKDVQKNPYVYSELRSHFLLPHS
ncbi:hypothetical protein PUN28_012689 [Cardiocondyla obscurior]|uniref:Uncharacterized protein n=1 Tax=Cardiocondyla obscurior TaxID=286306 RepID=A0AAW2FH69_9HYME